MPVYASRCSNTVSTAINIVFKVQNKPVLEMEANYNSILPVKPGTKLAFL